MPHGFPAPPGGGDGGLLRGVSGAPLPHVQTGEGVVTARGAESGFGPTYKKTSDPQCRATGGDHRQVFAKSSKLSDYGV